MLTISKPTLFNSDGLATRGQCNHDSPGWQLRWFDRKTSPVLVWQGAFKTCRQLQASCSSAASLEEVKSMVEDLLNANSFTHFANQPTDAYPTPIRVEMADSPGAESGPESGAPGSPSGSPQRKRRKKRKH